MAGWEYTTIVMGSPDQKGRRWVTASTDPAVPSRQVGEARKPRFSGRIWQALQLLETALEEMDKDGWELVSHSFSGLIIGFYGTAILRRPAATTAVNESS